MCEGHKDDYHYQVNTPKRKNTHTHFVLVCLKTLTSQIWNTQPERTVKISEKPIFIAVNTSCNKAKKLETEPAVRRSVGDVRKTASVK